MAKSKPKLQVVEVEEGDLIETGEEINLALERLYADADATPDDATAHVYLVEADGQEPKIWKGNAANYDLDALARKHGSGNYRLKVYVPTERGNVGCKINKVIPYRLSAEEDARLRAIRSGEMPVLQSGAQGFTLESIVAAVKTALPAPVAIAPQNNLGMMKEVAEIVRMLAPQPQAQVMPQFNPLELMRAAADLTRGRDDGDEAPRGNRAPNATDVFIKLIDRFAPAYVAAMSQANAALSAPADATPTGGSGAQPAAVKSPEEEAVIKLRMGVAFLVAQAALDSDPETYADVVMDHVPADDLQKFMGNADPISYLAQFDKRVLNHREWFTELIAAVKVELETPAPVNGGGDDGAKKH